MSATDPRTRPRDFDRSARRDLVAVMQRFELRCACIDCFVPSAHFLDPAHVDRVTAAAVDAIELAAEIASIEGHVGGGIVVLSAPAKPEGVACFAIDAIRASAEHHGVCVAIPATDPASIASPFFVALDPAQILANSGDPQTVALAANGRIGAVRIVDLLRSGSRGPIHEPQESQLDCRGFVIGCRAAGFARDFVVDLRQWIEPERGLLATLQRWRTEVDA